MCCVEVAAGVVMLRLIGHSAMYGCQDCCDLKHADLIGLARKEAGVAGYCLVPAVVAPRSAG